MRLPIYGPNANQERNQVRGADDRMQPAANAPPCELPAPTEHGRVYAPPHPAFAIAFLYAVALGLQWGAMSGGDGALGRAALTYLGLCCCLVAAVRWLESVDLAHVPAKLGFVRASGSSLWVGAVGAIAALVWWRGGLAAMPGTALDHGPRGVALLSVALVVTATWNEAFYRGFVFRGLMRRHGFLLSAAASALLPAAAVALVSAPGLSALQAWMLAAAEVPLSFSLCTLFWLQGQSLAAAILVRLAVLSTAWTSLSPWPALSAAFVIFIVLRLRGRASR